MRRLLAACMFRGCCLFLFFRDRFLGIFSDPPASQVSSLRLWEIRFRSLADHLCLTELIAYWNLDELSAPEPRQPDRALPATYCGECASGCWWGRGICLLRIGSEPAAYLV